MAIDLSTYHIVPGDDTELPTKLNDMMDDVQAGVNGGLSDIDDNLNTLSSQITSELGDAVDTVEAAGVTAVNAADTATTQAGIATGQASAASGSADAAAGSAATAEEIANISEVQQFTNPLAKAIRIAITSAATRGIKITDNDETNFGTGAITMFWLGKLDPVNATNLIRKRVDSNNSLGLSCLIDGTETSPYKVDAYLTVEVGSEWPGYFVKKGWLNTALISKSKLSN